MVVIPFKEQKPSGLNTELYIQHTFVKASDDLKLKKLIKIKTKQLMHSILFSSNKPSFLFKKGGAVSW